ncbi:hypothetical protein WMY93_027053 [Mugilogobius chulae]|uniref:Selenoprotein K n=1 Tax=Mugilogobius chulae TaxID=88201 RepID=A0AAW0N2S1_9GOBI
MEITANPSCFLSSGQVLDNRTQSPWRLSLLVDLFWDAVEFVSLFFRTIFNPDMSKNGQSATSRFIPGAPWWSKEDGQNNPRRRSKCSTNGRRRMRKVNACTVVWACGSSPVLLTLSSSCFCVVQSMKLSREILLQGPSQPISSSSPFLPFSLFYLLV